MADKAIDAFVKRNFTNDEAANKKGWGMVGEALLPSGENNEYTNRRRGAVKMAAGALGAIPEAIGRGIKYQVPNLLGGMVGLEPSEEAKKEYSRNASLDLFKEGAGQMAAGIKTGLQNTFDMKPVAPVSPGITPKVNTPATVAAKETAPPVDEVATPSVEAPTPAGDTGPWSREKRNEHLGLNEGEIVKGGGPGGTDLLTNREHPFTQPKELPQEAYGVGGSKEKEAMMADYEKEMRTPFASVEKIKAMERRLGIGKEISPFEEKRLSLEEKKIAQDADQFAKTHDMKIRQNQEQLAMAMGGFTETEVPDPAGTGTIKVRTPNPEFFKEAFDEEGNFDLKNAMKSIENSRVFQSAKAKLGADPKNATVIKERLKAAGYSDAEIKKRLGI
jgi:hypothetical protein